MPPRHRHHVRVHRKRLSELERELERVTSRLESAEQRLRRVENTMYAIGREANVSIANPCKCGESRLIVKSSALYCPACGYRRSL